MVYLFVNKHAWFHVGGNLLRKVLLMKFESGNAHCSVLITIVTYVLVLTSATLHVQLSCT